MLHAVEHICLTGEMLGHLCRHKPSSLNNPGAALALALHCVMIREGEGQAYWEAEACTWDELSIT